jgi:hypothetical protein
MSLTLKKSIPLTAAAFAATLLAGMTLPGTSTPAEARRIVVHIGGHGLHFHRRHFIAPVVLGAGYGTGCYWLKRRAIATGSPYWWDRYNACIGY